MPLEEALEPLLSDLLGLVVDSLPMAYFLESLSTLMVLKVSSREYLLKDSG